MNKKVAFALFVGAATIFNFITTAIFFFAVLALFSLVLAPFVRLPASGIVIIVAFVASVVMSTVTYRFVLKFANKRFGLEKKLNLKS